MLKVLLFIVVFYSIASSAPGDITSITAVTKGDHLRMIVDGLDTGGTWLFGFADSTHKIRPNVSTLFVDRQGYNTSGVRSTFRDTVYIDTVSRRIYPNTGNDSTVYANNYDTFNLWLSEYIFDPDSIVGSDVQDSIYLFSGTPTSTFSSLGLNESSRQYSESKAVANWTMPERAVVSSDFKIRIIGHHRSGKNRKALQCVKFTVTDNHSNTWSTIITDCSIDSTQFHDSIPIGEWVATVPVSSFTLGDSLTCNFTAYPLWGDSLYSGDGVNTTKPTPLYAPRYFLYKSRVCGVIDSVNGDDATGDIVSETSFSFDTPPDAYKTLVGFVNGVDAYYGGDDVAGGVAYVRDGGYNVWGGTMNTGVYSSFNFEFNNWPGELPRLIGASGTSSWRANSYIKFKGFSITNTAGNLLTSEHAVWVDSCFDNRTSTGLMIETNTCNYLTNCWIYRHSNFPYTTTNSPLAICRNVKFNQTNNTSTIKPYVFIGNKSNALDAIDLGNPYTTSMTVPVPDNIIIYGNYVAKTTTAIFNNWWVTANNHILRHGIYMANNIFEKTGAGGTPIGIIAGDASISDTCNNVHIIGNVFVGQRVNGPYNDYNLNDSLHPEWREFWEVKNNIYHQINIVTDIHSHGGTPGDHRHGNWSSSMGVSYSGNVFGSTLYPGEHLGIKSIKSSKTIDNTINNYLLFVSDKSYYGAGGGFGDYHLQENSPAINRSFVQPLKYDIAGALRGDTGAAGAYVYGTEYGTCTPPVYVRDSLIGKVATSYRDTVRKTGGTFDSVTILQGTLPSGLLHNKITGVDSGMITATYPRDSVQYKIWGCVNDSGWTVYSFSWDSILVTSVYKKGTTIDSGFVGDTMSIRPNFPVYRIDPTLDSAKLNDGTDLTTTHLSDTLIDFIIPAQAEAGQCTVCVYDTVSGDCGYFYNKGAFVPDSFDVTIINDGTGDGTHSLDPPGGRYETGTEVTLHLTPDEFSYWVPDDTIADTPYVFTVIRDSTLLARFILTPLEPPVITVDPVSVADTINRDTLFYSTATGATSWRCQIWSDGTWTDTVANDSARVALTQSRDNDSIRFIASNTGGDDTSAAALITVLADTSAYFNVVVLPDMHIETALNYQYAKSQAQWIIANKTAQNIKYVVTVGDLVTNAKTRQEWLWADSIFDMLDTAKVPYAIATGNHDYDSLGIRRLDSMAIYFPKTRLSNNFWWNGKFCDSSKICESGVNTFTAYGNAYGVMTIEAFPRDTITAWAKEYLDTSSNYYNILSTHSYLDSNNTITSADVTVLTGEDMGDSIWKKLRTTDINFIVSGDIGGKLNSSGFRVNYTKQKTYCNQFNNDYQLEGTSNGGLGYLRIYKFKPIANRIEVRTYSPYLNLYSKTDYRDNFATYMFTPDSIGKLPNKYIKHALLPTAAKLGYNPDSTTGNFTVDNTAGNKYLIYRGPRNDTDITVTGANLTYANGKLKFNNSSTYITSPTYRLRFGQHDSLNISQLVVAQVKWTAAKDLFGDQGTGGFGGLQFYQSITPKRFRVLMQPTATTGGYAISKSVNPGATDTVQLGYEIDGGAPHVYYNGALHDSLTKNITHDTTVASALYGFCDIAYFDTAIIAAVLFDTSIEATGFSGIYASGGSFGGLKLFDNNFLVDSTFYKIDDLDLAAAGRHRRWGFWKGWRDSWR